MSKRASAKRRAKSRGTPKWLTEEEMDAMARRRCLTILSVLSGETSVSEAVAQQRIARQTYYQMEERGLRAMLAALVPTTTEAGAPTSPEQKIAQLETKVARLEQSKRRLERLLLLTRKVVKPGRLILGRSPSSKPERRSTKRGNKSSPSSKATTSSSPRPNASTPTQDGGDGRSAGSVS